MDADLLGGLALLRLAQQRHVRAADHGVEAPGVAVGDHAVGDGHAGRRPGGDGPRAPEVHVVGVRGDHEHALDLGAHRRPAVAGTCGPAPETISSTRPQ